MHKLHGFFTNVHPAVSLPTTITMEQKRSPDEKQTCRQHLVRFQHPLAFCCIVKGTSVSGDGVHAQVRTQLYQWLVFEDLAARRVLECNTHPSLVSQVHQEYSCVGHGVAHLNWSISQVAYEAITSAAFAFAAVHPDPGRADRCCPKQSTFFDLHDKAYCTVKTIISTNVMQLIGGLVERGSLVPHLGSSLRNRPYSCKQFKTIQVAADCLHLRIAQEFCDQLPADIGISKLAQSHHGRWTQGAGSKAQDASTTVLNGCGVNEEIQCQGFRKMKCVV